MKPIRLVSGFLTVGVWTLLSRVLGFARDIFIAGFLGTGAVAEVEPEASEDDELWSAPDEQERARQEAASRAEADRQREAHRRAEIKQRRRQRAEAMQARRQRRESAQERRRRRRKAARDR